ncbi:MAG: hypothetical protein C4523_13830 [Myxococcales bacterium]|nr:MAG: hypothetical protein C4523_13830 [Myxococcales bacterium]
MRSAFATFGIALIVVAMTVAAARAETPAAPAQAVFSDDKPDAKRAKRKPAVKKKKPQPQTAKQEKAKPKSTKELTAEQAALAERLTALENQLAESKANEAAAKEKLIKELEALRTELEKRLAEESAARQKAETQAASLTADVEALKAAQEETESKPEIDVEAHAALDLGFYQEGAGDSGFILREAEVAVGYAPVERFRLLVAPEWSGYAREFGIREAYFDVDTLPKMKTADDGSEAVEETSPTRWRPARRFGRDAERYGFRPDTWLAVRGGKLDLPFGIHGPYDRARHRFTVAMPLPIAETTGLLNDLGLMAYGAHPWVNYQAVAVNGRLGGFGAGARLGVTPFDWLEFAANYLYEFQDPDSRRRFQLIAAEAAVAVWHLEFVTQYTWEQEKTTLDNLFHYGWHGEARAIFSPVYAAFQGGVFHRGGVGNSWRLGPTLGWWAIPKHLTVKGEYQFHSEGRQSVGLLQAVGYY